MSIDTGCMIMVGIPYDKMIELHGKDVIDTLIHDGELEISSIYFDSPYSGNICGKSIAYSSYLAKKLTIVELSRESNRVEFILRKLLNDDVTEFGIYLVNDVT